MSFFYYERTFLCFYMQFRYAQVVRYREKIENLVICRAKNSVQTIVVLSLVQVSMVGTSRSLSLTD